MSAADAQRPQASSVRTGKLYQPGLGPHTEAQTVALVMAQLASTPGSAYVNAYALEVAYPTTPRSKCDLCLGPNGEWEWALEIKMLRLMGDNGKPNDNILMHILSPYPAHRSALTDCEKLIQSGFRGRKGVVIFGYDYEWWPMEPALQAFEQLAQHRVRLSGRVEAHVSGLVHPVHRRARVVAWELNGHVGQQQNAADCAARRS
jgi:hypothetical protein